MTRPTRHSQGRCAGPPACRRCVAEGRARAPRVGEGAPLQHGVRVPVGELCLSEEQADLLAELAGELGSRAAVLREGLDALGRERGR